MRSTELFAAQTDNGFRHFYPSAQVVSFCYDKLGMPPIVPVRVIEDPTGTHFAWWKEERGEFSMVYPARMLVEMCSPDHFKSDEAAGRGKLLQVRVELR